MPSLALAGFTLRPAAPGDFDPVLALISAQNTLDYGEALVSAGSLRASWESPALDLAQQEKLTGVRVVKAFARQDYEKSKFEKDNWGKYLKGKILLFMHSMFWPLSDIVL